jgi:tetratricopeptide (TPR) repeat protein
LSELASSLDGERIDLVTHLLRCATCRERALQLLRAATFSSQKQGADILLWTDGHMPVQTGANAEAPGDSRVEEQVLASALQLSEAKRLLARLLTQAPASRRSVLTSNPRLHTVAVCELLTERALAARPGDGESGEELGGLALQIAAKLDPETLGSRRIVDLQARAWASIANDRRMRSDLHGARKAMATAFDHLRAGTGDPLLRAMLLDLRSSLLRALRRFDAAIRFSRRAFSIFQTNGERHRAGRVLLNMGNILHASGRAEAAIPLLHRALAMIDRDREPELTLAIWHNLIDDLTEIGRFSQAQALFTRAAPIYNRSRIATVECRRRWVQGKISLGLGRLSEAESHFLAARDGFLRIHIPYDAALVSLQLVLLYAEQRRVDDLKTLAGEILHIFTANGVEREALGTLACLHQAERLARAV